MNIDSAVFAHIRISPYSRQQLLTAYRHIHVLHEENKQAEFTRSERDRLAVKCDLPSVEIGDYIPEFQNIFVFVRTAQYRFNTCQQFNCFKRLCDIIICARAQTAYLVVDVAFCREEYDRDLASAYFFNYFKAVLAGSMTSSSMRS